MMLKPGSGSGPAAAIAGLAAAGAGGAVIAFSYGLRQPVFSELGFQEARWVLVIPALGCSAAGSLLAGILATSRPVRGAALAALAISALLVSLGEGMRQEGFSNVMATIALACGLSAIGAVLTVLGAIAIVQAVDKSRALYAALGASSISFLPSALRALDADPESALSYFVIIGVSAVVLVLWGPSSVRQVQAQLAFAPVGPAPLSAQAIPSQTLRLASVVVAASTASWAAFQAPQVAGYYFETFDLVIAGLAVTIGVAAMTLGDTVAARMAALAIAGVFGWTLAGAPPLYALLGAGACGSLADFVAIVLASRYGQQTGVARRIGGLMALGTLTFIPLNLLTIATAVDGVRPLEADTTQLSVALVAMVVLLVLLLQMPRARSPVAAW